MFQVEKCTKILTIVLCLLVSGCSFRKTVLNNADALIYWELDEQFDFTSHQKPIVKQNIRETLRVLKSHVVPLGQTIEKIYMAGLDDADLPELKQEYLKLLENISKPLAELWVETYLGLEESQVNYFENQLKEKEVENLRKSKKFDPEKREQKILDLIENWYGEPSDEQILKIKQIVKFDLQNHENWRLQRQSSINSFLEMLRDPVLKSNRENAKSRIADIIAHPQNLRKDLALDIYNAMRFGFLTKWVAIDAVMSAKQRANAVKEFDKLQDEINSLEF